MSTLTSVIGSEKALKINCLAGVISLSPSDSKISLISSRCGANISCHDESISESKNIAYRCARAKKRPASFVTVIGISKTAEMCSVVITSATGPETAIVAFFSKSAWVVPAGISSIWCVTTIIAGAAGSAAKAEKRVSKSSRPPKSSPEAGSSCGSSAPAGAARCWCTAATRRD